MTKFKQYDTTKFATILAVRDLFLRLGGFDYPVDLETTIYAAPAGVEAAWAAFLDVARSDGTSDEALRWLVRHAPTRPAWAALRAVLAQRATSPVPNSHRVIVAGPCNGTGVDEDGDGCWGCPECQPGEAMCEEAVLAAPVPACTCGTCAKANREWSSTGAAPAPAPAPTTGPEGRAAKVADLTTRLRRLVDVVGQINGAHFTAGDDRQERAIGRVVTAYLSAEAALAEVKEYTSTVFAVMRLEAAHARLKDEYRAFLRTCC